MLRTGVLGGSTTVRIVNIDINPMAFLLAGTAVHVVACWLCYCLQLYTMLTIGSSATIALCFVYAHNFRFITSPCCRVLSFFSVPIIVLFICAIQQFTMVVSARTFFRCHETPSRISCPNANARLWGSPQGWIALGLLAGLVIRLVELYRLISAQASANRAMTRLLGINPRAASFPSSPSSPPLPVFHRVSPTTVAHALNVPSASDQPELFTLPGFPSVAFAPLPHVNPPATVAHAADPSQGQAGQMRPLGQLHGAREAVEGVREGPHALSWQAGSERGLSEVERQQLQRMHQQLALQLSLLHRDLVAAGGWKQCSAVH